MALRREVAHHALGVGAFGHGLDDGGLHLRAERLLHRAAAQVVLVGPAGLADRADVDEADLERRRLGGGVAGTSASRAASSGRAGEVFVHGVPLHGSG